MFLVHVATGSAGNYFASKYTDRRPDGEKAKKAKDRFSKLKYLPVGNYVRRRQYRSESTPWVGR